MSTNEILTIVLAFSGWMLAIIQTIIGYFERKKKQDDDILVNTLDYFTGGSQKRSVGISLIEGLIKKKENYSEIIVPLLANQFVYLLLSTDTKSATHEERNLIRIFFLLDGLIQSDKQKHWRSKNEVVDAINRRLKLGEKSTIDIASQTLSLWQEKLDK